MVKRKVSKKRNSKNSYNRNLVIGVVVVVLLLVLGIKIGGYGVTGNAMGEIDDVDEDTSLFGELFEETFSFFDSFLGFFGIGDETEACKDEGGSTENGDPCCEGLIEDENGYCQIDIECTDDECGEEGEEEEETETEVDGEEETCSSKNGACGISGGECCDYEPGHEGDENKALFCYTGSNIANWCSFANCNNDGDCDERETEFSCPADCGPGTEEEETSKLGLGEGDCDSNDDCGDGLVCGHQLGEGPEPSDGPIFTGDTVDICVVCYNDEDGNSVNNIMCPIENPTCIDGETPADNYCEAVGPSCPDGEVYFENDEDPNDGACCSEDAEGYSNLYGCYTCATSDDNSPGESCYNPVVGLEECCDLDTSYCGVDPFTGDQGCIASETA